MPRRHDRRLPISKQGATSLRSGGPSTAPISRSQLRGRCSETLSTESTGRPSTCKLSWMTECAFANKCRNNRPFTKVSQVTMRHRNHRHYCVVMTEASDGRCLWLYPQCLWLQSSRISNRLPSRAFAVTKSSAFAVTSLHMQGAARGC